MASSDSDEGFEFVDSLEVTKQIVSKKQPNLAKIKSWLCPTEYDAPSSEFYRHVSSKAQNTGEWIRETHHFQQWHSSNNHGSIWVKAVPGAGKSVLAATMIESLTRHESVPVLYFFFRQIIESNRTSRALLQDWLHQLLPFSEIVQASLWDLVEEKSLETISTNQLWKCLFAGLRAAEKVYCVVDALDEMNFDEEFLARLNDLGSFRPAEVKVLMTSRPKQYLQRALKDPQVIHVSLEEELVKKDISVFVTQRVAQFDSAAVDSINISFIVKTVCDRSDGLFLYARLMLDQIGQSIKETDKSVASIREMVARLPIGLEQMYNQLLFDHAESSKVDQSVQVLILQLVTQAARPLRLIELAKALEASPHASKYDKDSKEVVRVACGPLLEIMEDEIVQILHHSFTEFLLDTERAHRSASEVHQFPVIDPATAHRAITLTCIARLHGGAFAEYPMDIDTSMDEAVIANSYYGHKPKQFDFRNAFLRYPLVNYAARKWPYHAKYFTDEDENLFHSLEQFCDPQSPHFRAWLALLSGDNSIAMHKVTHLHVAAAFGLRAWTKHLIKNKSPLDALDSSQNSPLFWCAQGGHSEVAKLLLEAGAKPNIDGYDGLKPLHTAASRNYAGVVKLLLAHGMLLSNKLL